MLQEIELLNVDYNKNDCWYFENDEWISELYQLDKATLTGNIYIDQIREHDYNKYLDK